MMTWTIRSSTNSDREAILTVVEAAFGGGGDAVAIVKRTWELTPSPPGLELVAEHDGAILGHILAAPGQLGPNTVIAIAPLAVAPPWQRQGVGSALMAELLRRGEANGWPLVLVLGDPLYYSRFGFVSSGPLDITYLPVGPESPYFMVLPLAAGNIPQGQFTYGWEPLASGAPDQDSPEPASASTAVPLPQTPSRPHE